MGLSNALDGEPSDRSKEGIDMKRLALTISAAALAMVCGGSALAQSTAPVTMQPIPNPPEKAKATRSGKHHAKHHAKAEAKTPEATPDSSAPPAK
jgi:hypothetical protein